MNSIEGDVDAQLTALCRTAPESTGTDVATLTLDTRTRQHARVYYSDELGAELEEDQTTLGEGPSIDASRDGRPAFAADLGDPAARRRWPVFSARASERDMCAAFAFPLRIGAINLGALALFRHMAGQLHDAEISRALHLAGAAAHTMLGLFVVSAQANGSGPDGVTADGAAPNHHPGHVTQPAQFDDDISLYRPEVHQASGMVMVQLNVPIEEALARLRAYSFAEGLPLKDVARAVVSRRLRLDDDGRGLDGDER